MLAILSYIGLAGAAAYFYLQRFGSHTLLTADSAYYISAGRSLLSGGGLTAFDGSAFLYWPPLYPVLLGGIEFLGLDAVQHAALLNVGLTAILAVLAGLWIRQTTGNTWMGLFTVLAIVVSKPLWIVASHAWSESLFSLAVFASLVGLQRFTHEGSRRVLYLSAIFCAIALLTRHAGIFLVLSGTIYLLFNENAGGMSRWRAALLYFVFSIAPGLVAWSRVVLSSGDLSGDRVESATVTFLDLAQNVLSVVANWMVPWSWDFLPKSIAIVTFLVLAIVVSRVLRAKHGVLSLYGRAAARPFLLFIFFYSAGLIGLKYVTTFADLDDRILSPIYAPLVVWTAYTIWVGVQEIGSAGVRMASYGVVIVLSLLWLGRSALVLPRHLDRVHGNPTLLSAPRWTESVTIRELAVTGNPNVLYSNIPHALYLYAGLEAKEAPRKHAFGAPNRPMNDLEEFRWGVAETGEVTLVWFDIDQGTYMTSIEELSEQFDVFELAIYPDGSIYRVRLRSEPATN